MFNNAHDAASGSRAGDRLSHWEAFKAPATDPRTYVFVLSPADPGAGTISYFVPSVTKSLGFSTLSVQYMTVPICVVAGISLDLVAYSADRREKRRWHITNALAIRVISALVYAVVHTPLV